ncbi:MAG: hypothetical protein AB1697_04760 [Pseudomonadota bacterium]
MYLKDILALAILQATVALFRVWLRAMVWLVEGAFRLVVRTSRQVVRVVLDGYRHRRAKP